MKSIAQIAAELQGYDPQALSADQVSAFLERLALPVTATEELGIFEALGRVLARDVVSPLSVPPHDNSAMDGYALAGAQLVAGQPLTLRVVGTALAGKAWTGAVGAGECLKIMTGAIMPPGLDTVVPQEFTTSADGHITIAANVLRLGDNVRIQKVDVSDDASVKSAVDAAVATAFAAAVVEPWMNGIGGRGSLLRIDLTARKSDHAAPDALVRVTTHAQHL